MKLGAFILTFERPGDLERSVLALRAQTRPPDFILIVDNASSSETEQIARRLDDGRLGYDATGANLGSAGGTAWGNRRLAELGYDLIYTGDDDNPPRTPDTIARIVHLIKTCGADGAGAVGTRWDWRTGRVLRFDSSELRGSMDVDVIGGNQNLILRREVVEAGGIPDERLFFGYPDVEHCLRLRRSGYRLLIDGGLMLEYRRLAGRLAHLLRRSPIPSRRRADLWRNYYTTRNYIFMMRRRFDRPDLARREAIRALARSVASVTRGPGYFLDSTHYHGLGILDGYRARLGATIRPRPKVGVPAR